MNKPSLLSRGATCLLGWGCGPRSTDSTINTQTRSAVLQIILCSVSAGSNASAQAALRIWMAQCQATRDAGSALPHYGPSPSSCILSQGEKKKNHLHVMMCVSSWPGRALNVIAKVNIHIPTQWRIFYRLLIGTWLSLRCESGLIQRGQKSLHTNLTYHEKLHMYALCLWYNVKLENGASQYRPSLACDCRL
jgi:hypothetical protein